MRIGIVTQSFPPARGGVSEHTLQTALELQRRGHQVTVVTSRYTPFDEDSGLDVCRIGHDLTIPSNGTFANLTIGFRLGRQLAAIEAERKFDLVHIHAPLEPLLPMVAVKSLKAPKVATFHTYVSSGKVWVYDVFHGIVDQFFRPLDRLIAVSEAARDFIAHYFPGDYRIIPNGVDINRFHVSIAPHPRMADQDGFRLLFVGRLDPRKGVKYLLRAFPVIYQRLPNVRLTVVGSGVLRHYYQRFLPSVYRPRVRFEGYVAPVDLPGYYSGCDVFCAPALGGESFGLVLLEAMASGKPVVASAITGYQAVIDDGQDGLLVPPADPLAIAEAVIKLQADQPLRDRLAKQGRAKALKYSWEQVVDQLEEVYRSVVRRV